jgi:hypothetical protein
MVVSSAKEMAVGDGTHPTGYWAEKVLKPYDRFVTAGLELVIANGPAERDTLAVSMLLFGTPTTCQDRTT